MSDTASYRPADEPRLESLLVDLFTAALAHQLDAEDCLGPETRERVLGLRIQRFIRSHLHDPALTPGVIAAAHHISVSRLHRVFPSLGHGTTVSAWIRAQRLEGARRDLCDPAQRAAPVHRVAARWGFGHAAMFSRAFRAAYGAPPSDYRHRALTAATGGDGAA
ncbi:helix-turn-helix transcriptional regulator [Streptomyces sp. SBT349]|uniref:helix-turn-helix transcriptional regulator n=1 Tax=Streptomyces sp. SBT349 TaxID=1580539 RepID=UPI00066EDB3A|nr:helix-turn-helix transcriptional regulator [Streptomyces sp. SBT349]